MLTLNHEDYIHEAIKAALEAKQLGDWPFGAVVVSNGQVVGRGRAMDKTTGDVTEHAEIVALRAACKSLKTNNLNDCTIYCTNEPCLMCAATIFQAKIAKVVIGADREDLNHLLRPRKLSIDHLADDSGHQIEIVRGVCKGEVLALFDDIRKAS